MKLLFVCLGNICRSPAAEAIMNKLIEENGLSDVISCDSAGTIGINAGRPAYKPMREHASLRGLYLESIARQVLSRDFESFDYIIAMDLNNFEDLLQTPLGQVYEKKILKMWEYVNDDACQSIPDPYYGGDEGYEKVLDLLEDGCQTLLATLIQDQ
jgi:protein-tyrosine phosphatase